NVTIGWSPATGGGSVNPTSSVTGADGKASTTRTLGPIPGTQTTTASASGLTTVTFSITAQVGGATQMVFADSSVRHDTVGQTVAGPLAVKVMDALNNPVQGVTISWTVLNGGGSVNPTSFFFFQAEDGIRDGHVTGVQTCALPISTSASLIHVVSAGESGVKL